MWHGVPARSTFKAMRPACTSKFPPRRCGRAMVHVCVEIWGAAGPNPLSWPGSIGNILTPPRLPRFRCGAQCKMQWLEKPSMAYQTCFACANASQPDWPQHRRTPRALGDVTDCPNLAMKKYAAVFRTLGDVIDRPKARPTLSEFPYAEPIVWLCSGHLAFTRALDTWRCH